MPKNGMCIDKSTLPRKLMHDASIVSIPLLAEHLDVQLGVLEGLAKHAALALDSDDTVVDRRRDILGDLDLKARVNGLHLCCLRLNGPRLNLTKNFKQIETTQ